MLIVCPSCASGYEIDAELLGAEGRNVRCAACRETFFATPTPDSEEPETPVQEIPEPEPPISVPASNTREAPRPAKRRRRPQMGLNDKLKALAKRIAAPLRGTPSAAALTFLLGVLLSVMVAGRERIVQALPETARLYAAAGLAVNLRGLDFRDVRSELVGSGPDAVLVVEGEIATSRSGVVAVPAIEVAVRDAGGRALYTWTAEPPQPVLAEGETARFRARLVAPPEESRAVLVRFADVGHASAPREQGTP